MKWVGRLECGHDVGGLGVPPEVELEELVCAECTVAGCAMARWYRLVQVVTTEPELDAAGRAW